MGAAKRQIQETQLAIKAVLKAIATLRKTGLTGYLLFPLILNILVFAGGVSVSNMASEWSLNFISDTASNFGFNFESNAWYASLFYGIIWLLVRLIIYILIAYVGGYIVLLLLTPVLSILSQQLENKLTGVRQKTSIKKLINEILRGVVLTLRNMAVQIALVLLFMALSFVPVLGWASPILLFLVSAFYYGFAFLDYNMERKNKSIKESIAYMRQHRLAVCVIGAPFSLVLLIPFFGPYLAGFSAIFSVVSSTLFGVYSEKESLTKKKIEHVQ